MRVPWFVATDLEVLNKPKNNLPAIINAAGMWETVVYQNEVYLIQSMRNTDKDGWVIKWIKTFVLPSNAAE